MTRLPSAWLCPTEAHASLVTPKVSRDASASKDRSGRWDWIQVIQEGFQICPHILSGWVCHRQPPTHSCLSSITCWGHLAPLLTSWVVSWTSPLLKQEVEPTEQGGAEQQE